MNTEKEITNTLEQMGFKFDFEFIPYSKSRNAGEWESINWKVTVSHKNRTKPLVVDYSQGIGNLPKYLQGKRTFSVSRAIRKAIETGKLYDPNSSYAIPKGKVSAPSAADIMYSLHLDGSPDFDALSFEEWASDLGYDTDSRKAEQIFGECRRIGAWIRGAIGTDGIETLRTMFEDY